MKNKNKLTFLFSAAITSIFFVSCNSDSIDKVNNPIPYESIGGYDNSDQVATDNLVAKFSFEDNLTDSKGNITGNVGTSTAFSTGVKGSSYNGSSNEQRYFVGDASPAILSLNSYTIAFWMNSAGTVDPATPGQGKGAQGIFSIVRPLEFWGGLNVFLENPDSAHPNRIRLKIDAENGRAGVAWRSQGAIINIDDQMNTWIHVAFTYNAATSAISGYINGKLCANLSSFAYAPAEGVAGSAIWYADNPGSLDNVNNAPKYGDFEMTGTNGKVVFGSHQFETNPALNNGSGQDWATDFAGQFDEFRIYNAALNDNQMLALYKLEKDNR